MNVGDLPQKACTSSHGNGHGGTGDDRKNGPWDRKGTEKTNKIEKESNKR
jgi:hypothetical protein